MYGAASSRNGITKARYVGIDCLTEQRRQNLARGIFGIGGIASWLVKRRAATRDMQRAVTC